MKHSILVGGKAVIEAVMTPVPGIYATVVRDPEGIIHVNHKLFQSVTERSGLWGKPIYRGMVSLFEAMIISIATLQWSADIAMSE